MRNRRVGTAVGLIAINATFVVACVGGGGGLSEGMTTWDSPPSSRESAPSTREGAPSSREVAPPTGEREGTSNQPAPGQRVGGSDVAGAAFSCAGTYSCIEVGDDDTDTIVLTSVNGVCSAPPSGNRSVILGADGQLTLAGNVIGTWTPSATGFSLTVGKDSIVCTRVGAGGDTGGTGGGSGAGGGSGGGSGSTPTPTFDAGVLRDAG